MSLILICITEHSFQQMLQSQAQSIFTKTSIMFADDLDEDLELHLHFAKGTLLHVAECKWLWEVYIDDVGDEI